MAEMIASPLLAALPGVRHGFFTRHGGVSQGVYESLNVGVGSKDEPEAVAENRRRAAAAFGAEPARLLTCYQIHSAIAVAADRPWAQRPEADAVVTATPGLVCGALAADCAPVLIADPVAKVVAAAHAGWRGALGGIVEAAVAAMEGLGARRERMSAAVGPCIGPASYEVGLEFLEAFEAGAPGSGRFFSAGRSADRRQFDLPGFVLDRLAGARVAQAEWVGRDTYQEPEAFFSNRRALHRGEADYGRLLSAIMLEPNVSGPTHLTGA
jgi:YfiH family protein